MTTYTKRQYLADIAANEVALATVRAELEALNIRAEAGEQITEELSAAWNALHDSEWQTEQDRTSIERRWAQRKWTGADYAFAELVAANID